MIEFERSYDFLPLLLVASTALAILIYSAVRTSLIDFSLPLFFKLLAALLICIALEKPLLLQYTASDKLALLLDVSDSMEGTTADKLLAHFKESVPRNIDVQVFPFASEVSDIAIDLQELSSFTATQTAWSSLNIGNTNLEKALHEITSSHSGPVFLLSDGRETLGDVISHLSQQSIPTKLHPLMLMSNLQLNPGFELSRLDVPLLAPAAKSVQIRMVVQNTSEQTQDGELNVVQGARELFKQQLKLKPGESRVIVAESDPSAEGISEIRATLSPNDASFAPSTQLAYLSAHERERVLLLSGDSTDSRFLPKLLRDQAYKLVAIDAAPRVSSLPSLRGVSAIILNNVSKAQLPTGSMRRLERYVKDGGALLMIGGNRSFGLGGYIDTPIERIMPVSFIPPRTTVKRLNAAVSLVLDKSRSMAQGQKLEFVKEAARAVVKKLKPQDYIEVIGFDTSPFVVVRMGRLSKVRSNALERIGRLYPAGRTSLLPALDEARRSLIKAQAGRKHVIVLTDGKIPDAGPYYLEVVHSLVERGVSVSTVMLGSETDTELLRQMADEGGGAFYQTSDPSSLPNLFLQDVKVNTGEDTMRERGEHEVRRYKPVRTDLKAFPPLRGYVQTVIKPKANLELVAMKNAVAEPLLASWNVGKGTTLAFTSDVNGRWSSFWIRWSKFARFWTELIDSVRTDELADSDIHFDLRHYIQRNKLYIDLTVFSETEQEQMNGVLLTPNGNQRPIAFKRTARGRYLAELSEPLAGRNELRAKLSNDKLSPVAFHVSGELFGEKRGLGFDKAILQRIAELSGGIVNPTSTQIAGEQSEDIHKTDLSPWITILALLCFALGIWKAEETVSLTV